MTLKKDIQKIQKCFGFDIGVHTSQSYYNIAKIVQLSLSPRESPM